MKGLRWSWSQLSGWLPVIEVGMKVVVVVVVVVVVMVIEGETASLDRLGQLLMV